MAATLGLQESDFQNKKIVSVVSGNEVALNTISQSNPASTATPTNVSANAASVQLLAANTSRKAASVFNDADKALYLKYGTTASATSYKVKIAAGGYFEFPQPIFTGRVDGIWEAAPTGSARISEET